jgi:hypothetical protein
MPSENYAKRQTMVIQDIIQLIREKYVYPEFGEQIAAQIKANLENGVYDSLTNESELAFRLTSDLRTISKDQHWSVVYDPIKVAEMIDPETEPDEDNLKRYLETARKSNYGFERVERLKGNIGYIDLRRFEPSEYGGETASAAMNFVSNCDALIIDLRQNHGGYPSMVQLITSYLYDSKPRHINSFYYRPTDETQQFWTFPHVSGKRRPDIPAYLLISRATGSGAEEFAYNLKHMERAILIGENTLGAAHPVTREVVQKDFVVRLPYGRPINPITGSNWEGVGVAPDIPVPAEDALKTAHLKAIEHLLDSCKTEDEEKSLTWVAEIIASEYSPVELDDTDLTACAGEFGKRKFSIEHGTLIYRHQDFPVSYKLLPMTKTHFRLDEDIKFEFVVDKDGKSSAVKINYRDGRPEVVVERAQLD